MRKLITALLIPAAIVMMLATPAHAAAGAACSITPSPVVAADSFTVTATGFLPNTFVYFLVETPSFTDIIGLQQTDASGSASASEAGGKVQSGEKLTVTVYEMHKGSWRPEAHCTTTVI